MNNSPNFLFQLITHPIGRIGNFFILFSILFVFFVLIGIVMLGIYSGRALIYRNNTIDRQKIELRYQVYSQKWLNNLNIKIYQIFTSRKPVYLRIYMIMPKKNNGKAIIFHHGITANHVVGLKHAKYYLKKGYTFFCYDSRGYGDNQFESFCTYGVFEVHDLLDVVKSVHKMDKFSSIFLHGESMGGFVTLNYAVKFDNLNYVVGYITDSAYVCFKDVVRHNMVRLYNNSLVWKLIYPVMNLYYYYKVGKTIGENTIVLKLYRLKNPVLAIHSFSDASIPIDQYYKLINNVSNVMGYTTKNSPHCLTSIIYRKTFYRKISTFLEMAEKYPRQISFSN